MYVSDDINANNRTFHAVFDLSSKKKKKKNDNNRTPGPSDSSQHNEKRLPDNFSKAISKTVLMTRTEIETIIQYKKALSALNDGEKQKFKRQSHR